MVVDEGKLVQLLVEKTGMPREEVDEALGQLKKRLQGVKETGESFEITHFGTFSEQNGQLQFEADDRLATEINQKYAGMEPVELIEAFKETGADIPVEKELSPPVEEIEKPEEEPQEQVQPVEMTESVESETEVESEKPADEPEREAEEPEYPKEPAAPKAEREVSPAKEKAKKTERAKAPLSPRMKEPKNHPLAKVAAVLLLIGVLGAAGWFIYQNSASTRSPIAVEGVPGDSTGHRQVHEKAQPMSLADSADKASAIKDTAEQNTGTNVPTPRQDNSAKKTSDYGLQGSTQKQLKSAYTIVIHSFRLKSTVQDIADSLNQAGYRTVLFNGTNEEQTRWRLGLGQFKHVKDAQDAAQALSEPYQSNHFIKRYHLK